MTHREDKRDIPIVEDVDVVVCGGGPAGIAAAIACARQGARTRLIELHGSLGGGVDDRCVELDYRFGG